LSNARPESILEQTRAPFRRIAERHRLLGVDVAVLGKPLTPEEAIGTPGRRDFPILIGKERVLEAEVLGSRGQAFTDSPREYLGLLKDVLVLDLTTNWNRAIYVAALNAVLAHVGLVDATVHCKDDDPEECGREISNLLLAEHGKARIGLIGLNPAIAERLTDTFGADHVLISDLDADNVGESRFGVEIWDGMQRTDELIDGSDVVLFTGTTLVNGAFDSIWNGIQARGKDYLVYGMTATGVSELMGFRRICPRSQPGKPLSVS
jgi:uncharacterized protein (DUF4213/DUF364 family)